MGQKPVYSSIYRLVLNGKEYQSAILQKPDCAWRYAGIFKMRQLSKDLTGRKVGFQRLFLPCLITGSCKTTRKKIRYFVV
jgi:hypothetical protein